MKMSQIKSINYRIISVLFLALFSACGFKSLYNIDESDSNHEKVQNELAAITVKYQRKHLNQEMQNNIEDLLNPDNIKAEPKYLLDITLTKDMMMTFINEVGASGRNKVIMNATYNLKDIKSGDVIATGNLTAQDDFDVEDKRFANYTTQTAIELNLTKIIARNLRNALIIDLAHQPTENKND